MAQNRKSGRGASRQREAPQSSGAALRWFSLGLGSGLFLAFLLYMATLPPESPVSSEGDAARVAEAPQPEFDFWEVLPEQEIPIEVDPAEMPRRERDSSGQLLLQAGSFRQAEEADRLRAQLLLLGLDPRVEETSSDSGRWFRVVIGPFESRSAMARAQSLTAQQDIETLLVRRNSG